MDEVIKCGRALGRSWSLICDCQLLFKNVAGYSDHLAGATDKQAVVDERIRGLPGQAATLVPPFDPAKAQEWCPARLQCKPLPVNRIHCKLMLCSSDKLMRGKAGANSTLDLATQNCKCHTLY